MAGIIFEKGQPGIVHDSPEYADTAAQLLTQGLSLVTECLQMVSSVSNKGEPFLHSEITSWQLFRGICGSFFKSSTQAFGHPI